MSLDEWRVLHVGGWEEVSEEVRGKRVKRWVRDPQGGLWLRKQPLESPLRPYEPAVEAIALRLARAMGLNAPESFPCEWLDDSELRRGFVVRLFLDRTREGLILGGEVLGDVDTGYDPDQHEMHQLLRVREVLEAAERVSPGIGIIQSFVDLLVYDALIGNGDRHQENWGLVAGPALALRLAPVFDPAPCLGVELRDDHALLDPVRRTADQLRKYVERCPSGFGDGSRLIGQRDVMRELCTWPEWKTRAPRVFANFERVRNTALVPFLASIADEWYPPARRAFTTAVLEARAKWFEGLL